MENSSKRRRLRAPSPAMVVACIALAITLSGVAYAALPSNSVGTAQLKNGAVTTPKLANNAVATAKIQAGAVTAAKIAKNAVTNAKIANGAVSGAKIADGAVTSAKIADDAVGTDQIADGSITEDDLEAGLLDVKDDSVGTDQLQDDAVNSAKIEDGSIMNDDLADDSVDGWKILDGSIDGDDIGEGAIGAEQIADESITADKIDQSTLDQVDAAMLGGFTADDFMKAPEAGSDAFVGSGLGWIDADGLSLSRVQATYEGRTTWCTRTGAQISTEPAATFDLHLPQGAIISEINVDYLDDAGSTAANGVVRITRQPIFSGSGDGVNQTVFEASLANTTTAGAAGIGTSIRVPVGFPGFPNTPPIDNLTYSYSVTAHPGALTGVGYCTARVIYQLP
jgi:hypothetical protein